MLLLIENQMNAYSWAEDVTMCLLIEIKATITIAQFRTFIIFISADAWAISTSSLVSHCEYTSKFCWLYNKTQFSQ